MGGRDGHEHHILGHRYYYFYLIVSFNSLYILCFYICIACRGGLEHGRKRRPPWSPSFRAPIFFYFFWSSSL